MTRSIVLTLSYLLISAAQAADPSAQAMLDAAGFHGGVIIHVGVGNPERLNELASSRASIVQALDTDTTAIGAARKKIAAATLYGRVTVEHFDGKHLPYIDNLVNLIIVDGRGTLSGSEISRVLAPRGVALIQGNCDLASEACAIDGWKRYTKPVPAEVDDWTHWLHSPTNNAVSKDRRVGVSRYLQWTMPPHWGRHHNTMPSITAMVSSGGRIYYIYDEAPVGVRGTGDRWSLICRDAYNGLELWRKPIAKWGWKEWSAKEFGIEMRFKGPHQLYRRMVAVGDTLYVTLGFRAAVSAIDGRTGKIVKTYTGTEDTAEILATADALYLTRNVLSPKPGKSVLCVDPKTGAIRWRDKGYTGISARGDETKRFTDTYLTLGNGRLFFLDGDNIICLNAATGRKVWTHPRPEMQKGIYGHSQYNFRNLCTLAYNGGVLVLAQTTPSKTNLNKWQQKDVAILAIDAATGKKLWQHMGMTMAHFTPPDLFINRGMVWTLEKGSVSLVGIDLRTGKQLKKFNVKDMQVGHHHRCYRDKATEQFYLGGEEGIEYIDFANGNLDVHHWLRGACYYGILPANGLIYLPTHTCGCHANTMLNGFIALASQAPTSVPAVTDAQRLTRDSVTSNQYSVTSNQYSVISDRDSVTSDRDSASATKHQTPNTKHANRGAYPDQTPPSPDWPTFRHDAARSNSIPTPLPRQPKSAWSVKAGTSLTPPVVANGSVYLADKDTNEVICLNAATGATKWRFFADGGVDTPPTWHNGHLYFGTRSGTVYALSAAGRPIWRFNAAPKNLRLAAFGRLESPWPVNGAVLVQHNTLHFVAGRSMNLNGGMYVYALDAATGKLKQKVRLAADTKPKGETHGAVLPDVLISSGERIHMRNMWFDPADITQHGIGKDKDYLRPADGGLLDSSWFNASFWTYMNASAQMLAFDNITIFGVAAYKKQNWKSAGHDGYIVGSGYKLSAFAVGSTPLKTPAKGKKKGKKKKGAKAATKWTKSIPVRPQSLLVSADALYVTGFPDVAGKDDPWAAFDGRKGGSILIFNKSDGGKVGETKLPSPPVYDGVAAAGNRLYIALMNGKVMCFE